MTTPPRVRPKFPMQLEGLVKTKQRRHSRANDDPSQEVVDLFGVSRVVLRPQRPLNEAAKESARRVIPSGLGLDSEGVRLRMVLRLQSSGLRSEAVVAALTRVPRHLFVDAGLATQAYEDTSLPIGHGQTISKPSVVARMVELLMSGKTARTNRSLGHTLEIGTGCGYQAAVLAQLSRHVLTVERLRPLHDKALELLAPLRIGNIRLVYGDGMRGHPPNAPYDSIIAAAGGESLPDAWLSQLAVGGRLVAPVCDVSGQRQALVVVDRTEDNYERSVHETVKFVPLLSGKN